MITNSNRAEISLRISPELKKDLHVDVAIVGGGLAGGQVAFDLIQAGLRVALVEKTPTLGGTALRLDKGYPSDTCSMCMTWNKLLPLAEEKRVTILTNTEIQQVSGKAGSFTLDLLQKPRYVDASKCLACGTCVASCPVQVPDPVNFGLTLRRAIYKPVYGSVPNAFLIDPEACTRCGRCVETCFTGAIELSAQAESLRLKASWIVLATGLDSLPSAYLSSFGYEQYPGVITSFEMERLLSEKGPFKGIPVHPVTKNPLQRIAFLWPGSAAPAILSRSPIPALVTLGEIRSLLKVLPHLQVAIFYQEGTGQQEEETATLNPAPADELKATLANQPRLTCEPVAFPPTVLPAEAGRVILSYRNREGQEKREEFDLLVLATDLVPGGKTMELARLFGLELRADGRLKKAETALGLPTNESSRPGVFLAGTANGPQTMPQATVDASATAAELLRRLANQDKSWEEEPATAPRPEIRTGVFVCDCGTEIAGVVDTAALSQYATSLPGVDFLLHHRHLCSPEGIESLQKSVRETGLTRIVLAACSPRAKGNLFRRVLREEGINAGYLEMANVREQCAYVHRDSPGAALEKAKEMLRASLARVRDNDFWRKYTAPIEPAVLIVGLSPAALSAALTLANLDHPVFLVDEVSPEEALAPYFTYLPPAEKDQLQSLWQAAVKEKRVTFLLGYDLVKTSGHLGSYQTTLKHLGSGQEIKLVHAATILGVPASPILTLAAPVEETKAQAESTFPGSLAAANLAAANSGATHLTDANLAAANQVPDGKKTEVTGKPPRRLTPKRLAQLFHIGLTEAGAFRSVAFKRLLPLDTDIPGIVFAGTQGPKQRLAAAWQEGLAAAARIYGLLARPEIVREGPVAVVDPGKCVACLTCVRVCPFGVPVIGAAGAAEIDPLKCNGCGMCASECPGKAIQLQNYRDEQQQRRIAALFAGVAGE